MFAITALTTGIANAGVQMQVHAAEALDDPTTRVVAQGLIGTAQETVQQLKELAIPVGVVLGIFAFLFISIKGKWGMGSVIGGLFIGGLLGFGVGGGGTVWMGNLLKDQSTSTS